MWVKHVNPKNKNWKTPTMRLVVIYTLESWRGRLLPPKLVDLSSPNSHETQLLQLTTSTTIHLKTKNSLIFYVVQKHIVFCFLFRLLCSTYSLTLLCTTNKKWINANQTLVPPLTIITNSQNPIHKFITTPKLQKFSPYKTMYCCFSIFCFFFLLLILFASAHSGHDDSSDDSSENGSFNFQSKPLILVKIWCLILIFVGTFVGGVSPS